MKTTKKVLSVLMCVCLLCCAMLPAAFAAEKELTRPEKAHVCFGDDGKFKILNCADIQDGASLMSITKDFIKAAVKEADPDLIVMTGDNIAGYLAKSASSCEKAIRNVMEVFEEFGIPVAMVFGNHDDQGTALSKAQQVAIYKEYDCFIGWEGEPMEKSCANYNIPIYESKDSDKVSFNIWMMDSGNYYIDENGKENGYGFVYEEALDWYKLKSDELKAANGGEAVPSMVFQHIVPAQIYDAFVEVPAGTPGAVAKFGKYWVLPDNAGEGSILGEGSCPANLDIPEARYEFDTMKAQGDVIAIAFGHDHINSFVVPYEGIDLISCPGCTFRSYNDDNKGFRTFTLDKNNPWSYETDTFTFNELFADNELMLSKAKMYSFFSSIETMFSNLWSQIEAFFKQLFTINK